MPDPVAPPPPVPNSPSLEQHLDAVTALRQHGYTWDQVSQYYGQQTQRLRDAGYNEDKIRAFYGGMDPAPVANGINERVQQNVAAGQPKSWIDAAIDGLTNSSTAALLGHAPTPDTQGEGTGAAIVHAVTETIGDLPVAIPSAFFGGKAVTGALLKVPGLADTPIPETAGGLAGAFGAGAGPALIKGERDAWIAAGNNGWNAADFIQQHGLSAEAATSAATMGGVGMVTHGVGGIAEQKLVQAGVTGTSKFIAKTGAEAATWTAANSAIQGRMPTVQDFVDGSIMIAAFHVGGKASAAAMRGYRARLQQNYVETGQNPLEAAQEAKSDPVYRRELMGEANPPARPGSSRNPINNDGVQRTGPGGTHDPTAPPPEQYVVPRVAGHFDDAVNFTLQHEGGAYVIDANRAGVKWGINAADNPGVDVQHLSRADAAEIYKHKYWDAINADSLPANMRLAAFDTAVVEGPARAKQWLAESGGDPKVFLGKRAAFEASLAAKDPARYGRFTKAWSNRIRDLGGHEASSNLVGRDPSEPFTDSEQKLLENEGLPPEPPEKPPAPPPTFGDGGSDDGQHWDRVMDRVADKPGGKDWWGATTDTAQGIYRDLFNRDHPIEKLMGAVQQGSDIGDAENPVFLRRLAENTDQLSKYAIERNMTDLDGNVTGKGLKEIVEQVGDAKEQRRFTDGYAMSRWAQMMEEQGKKTGILDANRVVEEGKAKYEKPFQELVGWRNGTLDWLRDVHGSAKVDALKASNDASIPGYRDMGDGKWAPGAPGKNVWNPVKTALGSERKVQPITHSLMQDAFLRHALAVSNRANVALVDAAMENGFAGQKRAVDVNVMSALDKLKEDGVDDDVTTSLMRAMNATVPKDQVPIFRDGKLYGASFTDEFKDVVPVLRGYDQPARSTFQRVLGAITSVPRKMQTVFNPAFPVKLLTYDLPWQFITNPDAKAPLVNFWSGLGAMVGKTPEYEAWMRSGGAERVFESMSHDAYLKSVFAGDQKEGLAAGAMNLVKSPFHALQSWSNMVSTPLRAGRYIEGLKGGESPTRAAVASTEAAFHRPGYGGVFGKAWNTLVPYLTAHLNGLEKTTRAQLGIGETITGAKYDWKATTAKGLAVLTLPAMAQWWFNKDQDWYKAAPDWKKDNGFFIPMPGGGHMFIAAPPLISAIYIGIPRRLAEAFMQDNPHAFDNMGESFGASLMPPGGLSAASIVQPFIEHMANFSFFKNQPLVNPDTLKGVGSAEQFNHYSSGMARNISRFASDIPLLSDMKLSPPVVDNYIRFWAGDSGQLALQAADAAGNVGKANQPPAKSFSDWPIVSSWVARYPSASAQPIQDFYTRSDHLDAVHGSLKAAMQDGDIARFKQLAERDPSAAAYHMMRFQDEPSDVDTGPYMGVLSDAASKADWQDIQLVKEGQGAMKQASVYARKVWENPQLSAQDKRQILDQTYATMQTMATRVNEAMDRAHVGGVSHVSSHAPAAPDSINFDSPSDRVE